MYVVFCVCRIDHHGYELGIDELARTALPRGRHRNSSSVLGRRVCGVDGGGGGGDRPSQPAATAARPTLSLCLLPPSYLCAITTVTIIWGRRGASIRPLRVLGIRHYSISHACTYSGIQGLATSTACIQSVLGFSRRITRKVHINASSGPWILPFGPQIGTQP